MTRIEPWRPPNGPDIEPQPAGIWWDAVKVPTAIAQRTLTLLGGDSGAVIEDSYGAVWYWLVAPGAAGDWTVQRVLGKGAYVAVPPQDRRYGPGPHWRVAPTHDGYLTEPGRLHAALLAAARALKPCRRCDRLTDEPVAVAVVHVASGVGRTIYACKPCAHHFPPQRDPLAELAAMRRAQREGRA
ncbi:hypothetical protein LRS74_22525 [Streptomyces sp. LX-29]|uniref:hypothetical protein n=1 Tax=Streptomyces sp. LX-29 TaxID=2900152 RepID=UPI00240DAF3E|nr:hypothetical protein [Streptomyces sp. LX-29]WFB09513.1 hypothetical protein LRS74_22525 [Streptomyces sp. LX-29]